MPRFLDGRAVPCDATLCTRNVRDLLLHLESHLPGFCLPCEQGPVEDHPTGGKGSGMQRAPRWHILC
eukprot:3155709-Amphidinium_carterae.1